MQIIPRGSPALLFVPPAEENTLQVTEILLQVGVDLLQVKGRVLQVTDDGASPPDDLQHPILEMLQIILEMLRMIPDLLQIKVDLQRIDPDLQQNSGRVLHLSKWRGRVEESGEPGIRRMLHVSPDLQQINLGVLQI